MSRKQFNRFVMLERIRADERQRERLKLSIIEQRKHLKESEGK